MTFRTDITPRQVDRTADERSQCTVDASLISRLNAVRLIVVTLIAIGYSSTMAVGPGSKEWLNFLGYDPSLYGLQVLFFLSGWLAWRSLTGGRSVRDFIGSRASRTLPWVAFYTCIVAAVFYPILCNHDAPLMHGTGELVLYVVKTVTLIQPGQPMPGALDAALYACLLQGTIWTLRWGAIAFAGLLILFALRIRHAALFLMAFIALVASHVTINAWTDATGSDLFASLIPGLRLGMAFMFGIVVRQNLKRLPQTASGWGLISLTLLLAAGLHYYVLPWSYGIELLATAGWCALAMTLLTSNVKALQNWTNVVVPVYLGIWPITQMWLAIIPDINVPTLVILSMSTTFAAALMFKSLFDVALRPIHRRIQTA